MTYLIYFNHADGTPDTIQISGDSIKEIQKIAKNEMARRGATPTGSEEIINE